jgi:O-6-methylguanine DNA methyltransferase
MNKQPEIKEQADSLKSTQIETPLGTMLAIGNDAGLYLLQFMDKGKLPKEMKQLKLATNCVITEGESASIHSIAQELQAYFKGELQAFHTPLIFFGTPFQQQAWQALQQIPYGKTKSYAEQAVHIGKSRAYRAVANANGANHLTIVIPCHRIITSCGKMGGYSAGLHRKVWLLEHEKRNSNA